MNKVGVSILTNSDRLEYLKVCISAFIENCYYRPLVIAVFDNGSTDGTKDYLNNLPEIYGVEWRVRREDFDLGCARGTNGAINMVKDCKYGLHIESDFIHMPPQESGVSKMWLHNVVDFMENNPCDYLYLRRMRDENEMMMHWWSQWMPKVEREVGCYLSCPSFWWSNNPALRRTKALVDAGTLPLNEDVDGNKGTSNWSRPELEAGSPPNAWIHKWGMFVHEKLSVDAQFNEVMGCGNYPKTGNSTCKYGFFKDGKRGFCRSCDHSKSFKDMVEHEKRFKEVAG